MELNHQYTSPDAGAIQPGVTDHTTPDSPTRLDQFTVPNHAHAFRRPDGTPYTLESAIEAIHRRGAHYVLVEAGTKKPAWAEYQKPFNRPRLDQVWAWLGQGGRLGVIPGSIGLAVVDVDKGSVDQRRAFTVGHPPLCATASSSGRGEHLWYETRQLYGQHHGIDIPGYGLTVDVKCWNAGWILFCDPIRLAQALDVARGRKKRGSGSAFLFPEAAVYGAGTPALKRSVPVETSPREHRTKAVRKGQTPLHFEAGSPAHFGEVQQGGRNEALRAALVLFFKTRGREREIEDAEERWGRRIYDAAMSWNEAFPEPLTEARVRSTSRSTAGFLWERQPAKAYMADTSPDTQRARQRKQVESRRRKNRSRDRRIRDLRDDGVPVAQIAEEAGLSRVRVYEILQTPPQWPQDGHTEAKEERAPSKRQDLVTAPSVNSGVLTLPNRPPFTGTFDRSENVPDIVDTLSRSATTKNDAELTEWGGSGYEIRAADYVAGRAEERGVERSEPRWVDGRGGRMDQRVQCPANEGLGHTWAAGVTEIGAENVAIETCGLCGRSRFVLD